MKHCKIIISNNANKDIKQLFDFIEKTYHAPLTAKKYINGLFTTLESLSHFAESIPVSQGKLIIKYGLNVHKVNYKKWQSFTQYMVI